MKRKRWAKGITRGDYPATPSHGLTSTTPSRTSECTFKPRDDSELEFFRALGLAEPPSLIHSNVRPLERDPSSSASGSNIGIGSDPNPPSANRLSTSQAELGTRRDAPRIAYSIRAQHNSGAITEGDKSQLLAELDNDVVAASSKNSLQSLERTWTSLHRSWFGPHSDPLPLTSEGIRAVSAQMKMSGYRSFQNYLSRMKHLHVSRGFAWTQTLDLISKECTRSVARGIGPAKQSAAYPVPQIAALNLDEGAPLIPDGPVGPVALATLAAFFLLREN